MQRNKYQQNIIARKPCMETWFKKPLLGGLEKNGKLLIKSGLINFEIILNFFKIQASTAYCYVNNNHL